ncbi:TonB-dependent receptor [Flavobacterium sp. ANB]|uniref:TonB-dependent receptor domain-containing protein n=1 Tax=unclassified Flavobacterium TaxID=196869 RepID=UPI0012B91803|nr:MULTISPECIES: TonB-dependent receptor [unclassified Flavobacterium]MBF4515931.1 TonB-dependent receptor [Flavobacterium sp. ANB]MTD68933.1 TonB-dependent receptor [Flavobacterium sp. LC2016-13]
MKQFIVLMILLSGFAATAQSTEFTIKGKITDSKTKQPLPFASVSVSNSQLKKEVSSDADGNYTLKTISGNYQLTVEFMSYKTFIINNLKLESNLVKDISLEENINELNEVNVIAEKSAVELKIDKKVFNVGKDILSRGGSANDILNNVPSVNVDVAGVISLRGNNSVTVLINGKPSMLTANNGLSQISAANIERVEVITNPSAAYEAQGGAGIINIILKKNSMQGFNGSLQAGIGNPANHNLNANVSYKTEKINLFSNISYRYFDIYASEKQFQINTNNGVTTFLNQSDETKRNNNTYSIYVGGDYYINDKNTLTGSYYFNRNHNNYKTNFNYNYANAAKVTDSIISRSENYKEPQNYNALELNYVKTFDKKDKKWTTSLQYDFWNDDENQYIDQQKIYPLEDEISNLYSRDIESSNDIFIKSDFVNPITANSKIEMGIRSDLRALRSDYYTILDKVRQEQFTNKLKYDENLYSAYFQFAGKIKKFNYQLGLRSELSDIKIADAKNTFNNSKNYINLFPTLHFVYNLTEKTDLQLSYSKRINRPRFWQLNPFSGLSDLRNLTVGNPDLDPMFTNSFEFTVLAKPGKFSINPSVYYQHTTNYFQYIIQRTNENYFVSTPVNLDTEDRYGAEVSATYNPTQWLRLSLDFNYYKFKQEGTYENVVYNSENQTWLSNFRSVLKFPKIVSAEFSFRYRGKSQGVQTLREAQYNSNLGLSRDFLGDKMSVTLNVNNLFNSQITKEKTITDSYYLESEFKSQGRYINLNVIYRFNRKKSDADRMPDGN